MNKKKTIIAAIVLLLVLLVGGAIAYFTDTDSATNTFTIGKVDITLTEPHWVAANAENLLPGTTIAKDPTVTLASDSADAYVFVKVQVPCVGTTPRELFTYSVASGWSELSDAAVACTTGGSATHVYAHTAAMTKNEAAVLFENVVLDQNLTQTEAESLNTIQMPVNAYAIQKDNVAGATYDVWHTNFNS